MRVPMALANWKMEMTIGEALTFANGLRPALRGLEARVDIVICPPYTALYPVRQILAAGRIALGAQNVSIAPSGAYTGEISARLLADIGCRWVLLGHWEVRRHLGDNDETVRLKMQRCREVGLRPILLVGQGSDETGDPQEIVRGRLARILEGSPAEQVANMALVYEPESAIGVAAPLAAAEVAAGCTLIRAFIREHYGAEVAEAVRIIYGGSVAPQYALQLLASPEVDGLGAGRQGRLVAAFVEIVRAIARAKGRI